MTSPSPSRAVDRLRGWYRLLSGPDFGVGAAAALIDENLPTTVTAIAHLLDSGDLEPVESSTIDAAPGLLGVALPRYRPTTPSPQPLVLPHDHDENDGVHRVERYLLTHCAAASSRLSPGNFRFAEPGPLPEFTADGEAAGWFAAERDAVLGGQRLAYALRHLPLTWQLAEAAFVPLLLARRFDVLLAVQELGATAAEQLRHPAAGVLYARVGLAWSALGNHPEAVLAGKKALTLARHKRHGHEFARVAALTTLGRARRGLGQFDRALQAFASAYAVHESRQVPGPDGHPVTPRSALGSVTAEIALTHLAAGDITAALTAAEQSLDLIPGVPHRRRQRASAHAVLGRVLIAAGRAAEAIGVLGSALDLLHLEVDLALAGEVVQVLAEAVDAVGDHDRAGVHRAHAVQLYRQAGHEDLARKVPTSPPADPEPDGAESPGRRPPD